MAFGEEGDTTSNQNDFSHFDLLLVDAHERGQLCLAGRPGTFGGGGEERSGRDSAAATGAVRRFTDRCIHILDFVFKKGGKQGFVQL